MSTLVSLMAMVGLNAMGFITGLKQMEGATQSATSGMQKLLAGVTVVGITAGVVKGLSDCVEAAQEEQVGILALGQSVKASGADWDSASAKIEAYLAVEQRRIAMDDSAGRASISQLTQMTGDYNKALELMPVVADMAAGAHMDMASAAMLVGRAVTGNTAMLSRYGIQLEKGATAQQAIAEIQRRFAGQAEAYGSSAAEAQDELNIAMGNIAETIGGALLPTVTTLAKTLAGLATDVLPGLERNLQGVSGQLKGLEDGFKVIRNTVVLGVDALTAFDALLGKLPGAQQQTSQSTSGLETAFMGLSVGVDAFLTRLAGVNATTGSLGTNLAYIFSGTQQASNGFQILGNDLSVLSATGIQALSSTQAAIPAMTDLWYQSALGMQENAELVNTAMASAFASDKVQAALADIQGIIAGHEQTMAGLQTQYLSQKQEREFQADLQSMQGFQKYQAEHAALLAAGRVDDAAKLVAKFENEQAVAENAYGVESQVQQRALIVQEIQAQQSYIAQLEKQRDAILLAMGLEIIKAEQSGKIGELEAKTALEILSVKGTNQLKAELLTAETSAKIQKAWANDQIGKMSDVAEAMALLGAEKDKAADELKKMQEELADFKIDLPPMPTLDMREFKTEVPKVAASVAEKASEPVTKALSEVTSQIDAGIKGAKSAIEQLMTFDMPTEAVAGLTRYGEFIALAVSGIYTALKPEMEHLSALKEPIVTAKAVLDLLTGAKGLFEPVKEAEGKLPDIASWVSRIQQAVQLMGQAVLAIDKALGKDELAKAATAAQSVKTISDLFIVNLSGMNAPKADFAVQFDRYFEGLQYGATRLSQWMLAIPTKYKALLPQAAAASASIKTIMDLGAIDLSKFSPVKGGLVQFQADMKAWYGQAEYAARGMVAWMGRIPEAWQKVLPVAQASAQAIKGVMDLGTIDLSKMVPIKGGQAKFESNLKAYYGQFEYAARGFVAWMVRIPDPWKAALPAAQTSAQAIKGIMDLATFDLSKVAPVPISQTKFEANIKGYFVQLEYTARTFASWMREIPQVWREQYLPEAAKSATEIKAMLDLLSFNEILGDFGATMDYNKFTSSMATFLDSLRAAADLMVPALSGIKTRYGDALTEAGDTAKVINDMVSLLPTISSAIWDAWDEGGIPVNELGVLMRQITVAAGMIAGGGVTMPGMTAVVPEAAARGEGAGGVVLPGMTAVVPGAAVGGEGAAQGEHKLRIALTLTVNRNGESTPYDMEFEEGARMDKILGDLMVSVGASA